MKKRLEADLISIAHRILQIKNKSDVNQLYLETQKLYEKLSVLRFVEEHFGEAKPTIGQAEIVEKMKQFFEDNHLSEIKSRKAPDVIVADEIIAEEIVVDEITEIASEEVADTELELPEEIVAEEEIVSEEKEEVSEEEIPEKIVLEEEIVSEEKEEVSDEDLVEEEENFEEEIAVIEATDSKKTGFQPDFELDKEEEVLNKMEEVQISFFDLLAGDYRDTFFEKVEQNEYVSTENAVETPIKIDKEEKIAKPNAEANLENEEAKIVSLNDKLSKGIHIDLNDRIAFVKHLFGNSNEEYNRVLSQLITFNSFYETRDFIEEMVKPDYNNWEGKDNYAERFMEIIEKKFL